MRWEAGTAVLVALASVMLAVGCGGGGPSDQDQIKGVLETSFTTADPVQCDQVTQKGLQNIAPSVAQAPDPRKACRDALDPSSSADSIRISGLTVNGDHATATVTPQGGSFAGAAVNVPLVKEGGWKIDGLDDVRIVDRDAYLTSLEKAAKDSFGNDALRPRDSRCITEYIRRNASNAELERSLNTGDKKYAYDAARFCLGGGIDLIAITQLVETQLIHEGIDPGQARCLAALSIAGQKSATLEEFATSRKIQQSIANVIKKGAFICADAGR